MNENSRSSHDYEQSTTTEQTNERSTGIYNTNRVCDDDDDDDDRDDDDDCDESLYTVFNGPMYYYLYLFYGESWAPFGAAADDHDHC